VLKLVNIALGDLPVCECSGADVNRDGRITVNEIVMAVSAVLSACVPEPFPICIQDRQVLRKFS
jgi:hypothetical protein